MPQAFWGILETSWAVLELEEEEEEEQTQQDRHKVSVNIFWRCPVCQDSQKIKDQGISVHPLAAGPARKSQNMAYIFWCRASCQASQKIT